MGRGEATWGTVVAGKEAVQNMFDAPKGEQQF